jgi:hypothetical protein
MFEPKLIGRAPFDGVQLLHRESRLEPSSSPEKGKIACTKRSPRKIGPKRFSTMCDFNYTAFEGEFLAFACAIRTSAD